MHGPLPLGAIAIRRTLGEDVARRVDDEIRASLRDARAAPDRVAGFVRQHAREMAPDVIQRHIDLYVNQYTVDLDEDAVTRLLALDAAEPSARPRPPVFAYAAGRDHASPRLPVDGARVDGR